MKKILGIIAIALLFSFIGIQNATAGNWEITVNWTDDCDDCPTVGTYEYVVCLRIRNICDNNTEIYYSCVEAASNVSSHIFSVDNVCTEDAQVCYLLTANVKKRCVISEEVICWDYSSDSKSCDEIYAGFTMPTVTLD